MLFNYMEKAIQVYLIKSAIIQLLTKMLEGEETAIEKKTILEFANSFHKFFVI